MGIKDMIRLRALSLNEALKKNYHELIKKQASTKKGSPEWVSWHSGYKTALHDVLRQLESAPDETITYHNPTEGKDNSYH